MAMDRRTFITKSGAAVSAGGALLGGCKDPGSTSESSESAPAVHTRKRVRWRLASSFPRGLDTIFGGAEVLANLLELLSDGDFQIRVYPAGEIVPGLQVMDAVQKGTVDVGATAGYYYTGKNPALAFDTGVPFGLTQRQQSAWLHDEGIELMRDLMADFNIRSMPGGHTGCQMGGWFREPIDGVEGLRGLKFRIPGIGGEVMSRLGATVQVLAGGDIFPALERGAIDATEWVGPYDDEKLGFHQIAKHYYYPGWWEPNTTLSYYVNLDEWNKLSSTHRAMFETAARYSEAHMISMYDRKNPPALSRIIESGVTLHRYPDDIMKAARETAFELYEEYAANDPAYRKIYASWTKARSELYQWFGTAELGFAGFAFDAQPVSAGR